MFLSLLIITQVTAEWVEISQQHYRKPIRTHSSYNPFTTPDRVEVEETTRSWIHNRSVTEYNRNKPPLRHPNVGNVKRMPVSAFKPTEPARVEETYPNLDKDEFKQRLKQEPAKPTIELCDTKQKATIERVPNIGNVKRVQLSNTPVKSPVVNMEDDKGKLPNNRYEEFPLQNDRGKADIFVGTKSSEPKLNNRRVYMNKIRNQYNTEPASTFPTEDETANTEEAPALKKRLKPEFNNRTNLINIFSPKPTFITETEDFIRYNQHEDRYHEVTQSSIPSVAENKYSFTTEPFDIEDDITIRNEEMPKQTTKQTSKNYDSRNNGDKSSSLMKYRPTNKFSQTEPNRKRDGDINNDQRKHKNDNNAKPELNPKHEIESSDRKITNQDKEMKEKTSKGKKPDSKVNNMDGLMKIMKVVADTISQNSRRSFGGKMRYLHELKDSILGNIAERIEVTWPDEESSADSAPAPVVGPHRRSRAAHATSRGHHVHFPSSESALMTISFLTFAVFLIKLVLQVIHTYKNKAMMVAPVMVATAGRAARAHMGKN